MLYVILIVVLLVFVSVSNNMASRNMERESNAIVNEAIPILTTANSLLTNLINQETGLRGYQLAGNEQFLEPYTTGRDQVAINLNTLSTYDKKYPTLQIIMDTQAIPAITNLQKYYDTTLDLIRAGKIEEAKARVYWRQNDDGSLPCHSYKHRKQYRTNHVRAYTSSQSR